MCLGLGDFGGISPHNHPRLRGMIVKCCKKLMIYGEDHNDEANNKIKLKNTTDILKLQAPTCQHYSKKYPDILLDAMMLRLRNSIFVLLFE